MSDDLLNALVSGSEQTPDSVKAIVAQLRNKQQLGQVAALSGDPTLAPFGQRMLAENAADEKELGQRAIQNRTDDIRTAQYERELSQGDRRLSQQDQYHKDLIQQRQDLLDERLDAKNQSDVSDPGSQSTIDKIGHYQLPLPSLSRSPKNLAIIDAVTQQYPDYDATKYDEKKKAQMAFGTGKEGQLQRSADVAIAHLDTADEKADKLVDTRFPLANAIGNWALTQTGSNAAREFETAKGLVSDEINKFFINGGGALADRQGLEQRLAAAAGPADLHGVTQTLREMMGGQMRGLQGQFVRNGLGTAEDFTNQFNDRTKNALGLAQKAASALPGATGAVGGAPPTGVAAPPASPVPGQSQALPGAIPPPTAPVAPKRYKLHADGTITGG